MVATGLSVVVVGNGSNLLVDDGERAVLAVHLDGDFTDLAWREEGEDVLVEAGGGLDLPVAARRLAGAGDCRLRVGGRRAGDLRRRRRDERGRSRLGHGGQPGHVDTMGRWREESVQRATRSRLSHERARERARSSSRSRCVSRAATPKRRRSECARSFAGAARTSPAGPTAAASFATRRTITRPVSSRRRAARGFASGAPRSARSTRTSFKPTRGAGQRRLCADEHRARARRGEQWRHARQ